MAFFFTLKRHKALQGNLTQSGQPQNTMKGKTSSRNWASLRKAEEPLYKCSRGPKLKVLCPKCGSNKKALIAVAGTEAPAPRAPPASPATRAAPASPTPARRPPPPDPLVLDVDEVPEALLHAHQLAVVNRVGGVSQRDLFLVHFADIKVLGRAHKKLLLRVF